MIGLARFNRSTFVERVDDEVGVLQAGIPQDVGENLRQGRPGIDTFKELFSAESDLFRRWDKSAGCCSTII